MKIVNEDRFNQYTRVRSGHQQKENPLVSVIRKFGIPGYSGNQIRRGRT